MPLDHAQTLAGLDLDDPNSIVKAFAANTAFRAAAWEELTTEDNPYRRPVRPDDLAWLDYAAPMPAEKALRLSALLGHRMLRNVYDTGLLYLPPAAGWDAAHDGAAFYGDRNRVLGALAAPILERHLFTVLEEERKPLGSTSLEAVRRELREYRERREAEPGRAVPAVLATTDRRAAATFLMLQVSAYLPAARTAAGQAALGEYDAAQPGVRGYLLDAYRAWAERHDAYRDLLAGADLQPGAAAYWQLYLGTSLGRGNHLLRLARNRESYPELLGALAHHAIDEAAAGRRYAEVFEDGLGVRTALFDRLGGDFGLAAGGSESGGAGSGSEGGTDALVDRLLGPLARTFGPEVIERFHHGFSDARRLAELWDDDLAQQVAWADDIPAYQRKAELIDRHIQDNGIVVDLDTFVESNEETSTTHVHDEHRLVMIERGQMHFWNNVTHKIELTEGDKLLIPVSRLHGSTVLSGECTYHQPIIPEEMYRRF